jgi:hypothetical protein
LIRIAFGDARAVESLKQRKKALTGGAVGVEWAIASMA